MKQIKASILEFLEIVAPVLPEPIYWGTIDSVVTGVNNQILQAIGITREAMVGSTPYDYYPFEIADHIVQHNNEVIRSGKILEQEEAIEDITTGEIKYFTVLKAPLRDDEGNIIGIVGTSIDITERKNLEKKLEQAKDEALKTVELQRELLEQKEAFSRTAMQVAHDIRSPLSAVEILTKQLNGLPEEQRILLRQAVGRIHDIANNLISANRGETQSDSERVSQLLSALLLSVISEKRLQFEGRGIQIVSDIGDLAYMRFALISTREFKRMLSNLMNNASEAMMEGGEIVITLEASPFDHEVTLEIRNSGKIIPSGILEKLGKEQVSHGKKEGMGLGLTHAFQTIEEHRGKLDIISLEGLGTTLTVTLPIEPAPLWFAERVRPPHGATVVILDDDAAIHIAWDQRFHKQVESGALNLLHFRDPQECTGWLDAHSNDSLFLLFDYELLGAGLTGLDVIAAHPLHPAVVVTSHYESRELLDRAESLCAKVLPKSLSAVVEIDVMSQEDVRLAAQPIEMVVLDDSHHLLESLKFMAKIKGKHIHTYATAEALKAQLKMIPLETLIYVDSDLGVGLRGEVIAQELYDLGYHNLHLATGLEGKLNLADYPWLKSIGPKPRL